jgi:DnaJ-class molecular chaperone
MLALLLIIIVVQAQNPYHILGINKNANDQLIKKAFKELSLKYHPDLTATTSNH